MQEIIQVSVSITVFVMLMMLIIEYINVQTKGQWSQPLKKKKWLQIVVAALLGAIPGCIGVYTVVSLFTHKIVSFGALVAAMIATSGDEAFIMFAMMPEKALWITISIFVIAIVAGFITNIFYKNVSFTKTKDHHFHVHEEEKKCDYFSRAVIQNNFKSLSFTRGLILTGLIIFGVNLFVGTDHHNHSFSINKEVFSDPAIKSVDAKSTTELEDHTGHNHAIEDVKTKEVEDAHAGHDHSAHEGHDHDIQNHEGHDHSAHEQAQVAEVDIHAGHDHSGEHEESKFNLPKIIFIILTFFALFVLVTVPDHFIEEHAWNHVIKKHFLKIFLWTFGTLILIYFARNYFNIDIEQFAKDNIWLILAIAILIGVLPQSGPHMIFISLFVAGMIPFSILMVNSIVQDGHGSLPLFAENKKAFLHMKLINMGVGAIVGTIGILVGF